MKSSNRDPSGKFPLLWKWEKIKQAIKKKKNRRVNIKACNFRKHSAESTMEKA